MKKLYIMLSILFVMIYNLPFFAFSEKLSEEKDKGKSFYTIEEVRALCGINISPIEMKAISARHDSMLAAEYAKANREKGYSKVASIPDWKSLMSPIENQAPYGNCWAHASTGVVEGLLHYLYDESNIGIDLDEIYIMNNSSCGTTINCGLGFIEDEKTPSETSINSFPNYDNGYFGIDNYTNISGISAIKSALEDSPVAVGFYVYEDFSTFCCENPTDVYHYDNVSGYVKGHGVVIVGFSDADSCWVCKNSWGSSWGDSGYFKIGYGECCIESVSSYKATVDSDCYAKITPEFYSTLRSSLLTSWTDDEWAYVASDYSTSLSPTLNSDKTLCCYGNLTVTSGTKFAVWFDSTVKFASGKSLIINAGGEVEAYDGATFTKSSTGWSGIDIDSGSPGGIFDVNGDITIEYASTGIEVNYNYGIDNGSNTITIQNCTNNGISIGNYSPTIKNILFDDCGSSSNYAAIEINGASASPSIENVTIENSHRGVNLYGSSDASVEDSYIKSSNDRYSFYMSSYTGLDLDNDPNNILASYSSDGYAIKQYNATCDYINAENNWWGSSSPSSSLFSHPANIDYSPCEGSFVSGTGTYKRAADKDISKQFNEAANLEKSKNWADALEIYNNIIAETDNQQNIRKAVKCILRVTDNSTQDYTALRKIITDNLERTDSWYRAILEFILCEIFVREGNYTGAIEAFSLMADSYKGTSMEVEMLGRIASIYGDFLNDKTIAKEFADKATEVNPGQYVLRLAYNAADIEYAPMLHEDKFLGVTESFDIISKPKEKSSLEENDEFVSANPNPFNPATTITYSIKSPSHVSLNVYNITGQKVATLVDDTMSAGVHTVTFNGSDLASGMYFYRFESPAFEKKGKMLLVK